MIELNCRINLSTSCHLFLSFLGFKMIKATNKVMMYGYPPRGSITASILSLLSADDPANSSIVHGSQLLIVSHLPSEGQRAEITEALSEA